RICEREMLTPLDVLLGARWRHILGVWLLMKVNLSYETPLLMQLQMYTECCLRKSRNKLINVNFGIIPSIIQIKVIHSGHLMTNTHKLGSKCMLITKRYGWEIIV